MFLAAALPAGLCAAAADAEQAPASIELHKSFRATGAAGPTRPAGAAAPDTTAAAKPPAARAGDRPGGRAAAPPLERAAASLAGALGERLADSGSLHLPAPGGGALTLDLARTPLVEFESGRRVILDPLGRITAADAAWIAAAWPGFGVLRPAGAGGAAGDVEALLRAAGYERVLPGRALRFGAAATVLLRPGWVVLRREDDLLGGETHAVSTLPPGAPPLPGELRELARAHGVAVVELDAAGAPAGSDQAAWRDPVGTVTTLGGPGGALVFAELAERLALAVERDVPLPGAPGLRAPLAVTRGTDRVFVFSRDPGPEALERAAEAGALALVAAPGADISYDLGRFLARFGVSAIGPTVELHPPAAPGVLPRFAVQVPGWLIEHGGRRLLVTGAQPPPLLELYLAREGIDVFDYRLK